MFTCAASKLHVLGGGELGVGPKPHVAAVTMPFAPQTPVQLHGKLWPWLKEVRGSGCVDLSGTLRFT